MPSRKFSFLYSAFGLTALAFLLMNNSGGVASTQGQDRTGSPVSNNPCSQCHSGGSFSTVADFTVSDAQGNPVTTYVPGETYDLSYEITASGATRYGMQAVALLGNNSNAGSLANPSSNAKITTLNSRRYLEQNAASSSNIFTAEWTAPNAGSGSVTFYGSALAVNGNGGTSGDEYTNIPTFTLGEDNSSNTMSLAGLQDARLLPNRVQNELHLRLELNNTQDLQMRVVDMMGRTWRNEQLGHLQGMQDKYWSVTDLPQGWYQLQLLSAEGQHSLRFFKH